eukprot:403369903
MKTYKRYQKYVKDVYHKNKSRGQNALHSRNNLNSIEIANSPDYSGRKLFSQNLSQFDDEEIESPTFLNKSNAARSRKQLMKQLNDDTMEPWDINQSQEFIQVLTTNKLKQSKLSKEQQLNTIQESRQNDQFLDQSQEMLNTVQNQDLISHQQMRLNLMKSQVKEKPVRQQLIAKSIQLRQTNDQLFEKQYEDLPQISEIELRRAMANFQMSPRNQQLKEYL